MKGVLKSGSRTADRERAPGVAAPAPLRLTPALKARVRKFAGVRVAVWGDLLLDRFAFGLIRRLSREAPVPIIEKESVREVPGGGGNALMNLAALGARASVYGIAGRDGAGAALKRIFSEAGIDTRHLRAAPGWETCAKTRILAAALGAPRQQLARLDEGTAYRGPLAAVLGRALRCDAKRFAAIVVSDYGYGAVSPAEFARAPWPVMTAIDSRWDFLKFARATTATPNETELFEAAGVQLREGEKPEAHLDAAARKFLAAAGLETLLVTRGSRGSALYAGGRRHDVGVFGGEVADVTGAGDTVIAAFTLARATGADWQEAQALAAVAAGLKVAKRGTATISGAELMAAL